MPGSDVDGLARLVARCPAAGRRTRARSPASWTRARPAPRAGTRWPRSCRRSARTPASGRCASSTTSCACTARAGYGALKAILEILAEQEPLTLTEISQRMGRTPGSTKDYLSWLEDVDLVAVHRKRYRFRDPLLRLWVRLHCRSAPPTGEMIDREVREFAASCLT